MDRDQWRRRSILLTIGLLLLLSTGPVLGHHLPLATESLLRGVDHLGVLCLTALHVILSPVHVGFHVLIAIGFAFAVVDRLRAVRSLRSALRWLPSRAPAAGDPFWRAVVEARIDPDRVRIVDGLPTPALTVGLLTPRIYVADALAAWLSPEELLAVLSHERSHMVRRDPLRRSLLRLLACTLFWLPALRRLAEDLSDETEVRADDDAVGDRPLVLASAILRLARWPMTGPAIPVGTALLDGRSELLARRVRRLAGEPAAAHSHVTRRSLILAAAALALVWASGVAVAHPMPTSLADGISPHHCEHRHESAFAHLFCLGSPFASPRGVCPHHGAA